MRAWVLALGGLGCLALALPTAHPRLMWNATASVPVGLYRLDPPGELKVGDLVAVQPDDRTARLLASGGWLPRGVPLLKPVAALDGQEVCRRAGRILIDGHVRARVFEGRVAGRQMPRWSGCRRLAEGEIFLLATAPGSFDGRYFGPSSRAAVLAQAHPLWLIPQEQGRGS